MCQLGYMSSYLRRETGNARLVPRNLPPVLGTLTKLLLLVLTTLGLDFVDLYENLLQPCQNLLPYPNTQTQPTPTLLRLG